MKDRVRLLKYYNSAKQEAFFFSFCVVAIINRKTFWT